MTTHNKEVAQYSTAIGMLASGVIMCYLSFFLNHYEITGSVLGYMGLVTTFAGSIFGISTYTRNKMADVEDRVKEYIDAQVKNSKKK